MSSTKSSTKVRSTWGTSKTPRLSPTPARDLRFGSSAACAVFKCSLCQQFEHTDRAAVVRHKDTCAGHAYRDAQLRAQCTN